VPKIRVVVAENHPAMLAQLCQRLGNDYEVVLQPDVVLLDITMPIMDGLHAARSLRQAKCKAKIILLSVYNDPDFIAAALSSGADCYVAKARLSTDLDPAIRTALQGNHFISHSDGIVELSDGES
jgi:DNA-binding NarL/FixJ family response regulator